MILAFFQHLDGVQTESGNRVVYDVAQNEAHFGTASVAGHALRWELAEEVDDGALIAARVEGLAARGWLVRCDRVDFPPGGVAYLHTHPGPGIRCLLHGSIRIESGGRSGTYGPFEPWFESGPEPVFAAASETDETAFVRVMILPREWEGKRTIRYVSPKDAEKPKTQRATIFFDRPIQV